MKHLAPLSVLFLFLSHVVNAQLTGMTPGSGVQGTSLQTTITGNGIFVQAMSPPGNIFDIRLKQGGNIIPLFDWWNLWYTATVVDPNTAVVDFTIPMGAVLGMYDLEVTTGDVWDPWSNQITYTLPSAFQVNAPDGYITGTVYRDYNRNNVKDAGEPAMSGVTLILQPGNIQNTTNASGNYSYPVANGTYQVYVYSNYGDYLFPTGPNDTLTATVNNNNSPGNDFGMEGALISVTPTTGFRGINTLHQFVADRPIFTPGAGANGNVYYGYLNSTPTVYIPAASITVIDSFTIQANINITANVQLGNDKDVRFLINGSFYGWHYLRGALDIVDPPYYVTGNIFFDSNQNKLKDTGEPGIGYGKVTMTPDNSIAFSDNTGNFQVGSLGGSQVLTYDPNTTASAGLVLFTDSASYTMNVTSNISNKNFGLISAYPDYTCTIPYQYIFARCNSAQYAYFIIKNVSNVTCDILVWVKASPNMTYVSALPLPTNISNDTIYWLMPNVAPLTNIFFSPIYVLPGNGNSITYTAGLSALNGSGVSQFSTTRTHTRTVFCGMDPNDKQVTPPGVTTQNLTLMTDTLDYLIRFQNTGNDTAFKVVIVDTLDADLEWNSFEVIESSHSMMTELEGNGAVTFTFNNILLPDSNVNEPGSHGHVRYRIRVKNGLPDATPVNNTAYIYFDFNEAVVTNTTLNTMVYILNVGEGTLENPLQPVLYPNPFTETAMLHFENPGTAIHQLEITDLQGRKVMADQLTTGNHFTLSGKLMAKGVYLYRLRNATTGTSKTGRFVIQ